MTDAPAKPKRIPAKDQQQAAKVMVSGGTPLSFIAAMAKEQGALRSLKVSVLLKLVPGVEPAHARYALAVCGYDGKTSLGEIEPEVAESLVTAASEAQIEGNPTMHFPFWSEPETQ